MLLKAWCRSPSNSSAPAPSLSLSFQCSEQPVQPSSNLSTVSGCVSVKDTARLRRQIRFRANFFLFSFFSILLHQYLQSTFLLKKKTSLEKGCPGLSLRGPHLLTPPRFRPSRGVPATWSGHTLFTPTLFFRNLPSCGEEGVKAKRKHPGSISRSSFPERGRGRPRSGIWRLGWAPELC